MATDLISEWLKKARQGDSNSFSHLVEAFQTPVFNLCYRMLGDPQEAEDAAQETFWRAYQGLGRYDPQRSFITWLLSIAAHFCIDQQRKRKLPLIQLDLLPEEEIPDPAMTPEKLAGRKEDEQRMRQLLANLGPQDRAVIILRYWHDLSDEEIAQTLSLTISAVKSRLHRARKELAQYWLAEGAKQPILERRTYGTPTL